MYKTVICIASDKSRI